MNQQQQTLQDKKDGLLLLQGMASEETRRAIIRTFEGVLAGYLIDLLSPKVDDGEALHLRAKAMGVVDVLNQMGVTMSKGAESIVNKRVAGRVVRENLSLDQE